MWCFFCLARRIIFLTPHFPSREAIYIPYYFSTLFSPSICRKTRPQYAHLSLARDVNDINELGERDILSKKVSVFSSLSGMFLLSLHPKATPREMWDRRWAWRSPVPWRASRQLLQRWRSTGTSRSTGLVPGSSGEGVATRASGRPSTNHTTSQVWS